MLTGPQGEFILTENHRGALVFVVKNADFAYAKSLIEQAIAIDMATSFDLYWLSDDDNKHYLNNLCRSWQDALDNFNYTATDDLNDLLQHLNDDLNQKSEQAKVYIAGDAVFVQQLQEFIKQLVKKKEKEF